MGGSVASLWSGTFPERVARLALLEGLGPPESPESLAPDRVRSWIDGVRRENKRPQRPMTLDDAIDRLSVVNAHVPREIVARHAAQLTRPSVEDPSLLVWKFDTRHRTTSPIGFSLDRWRAHVARITAPTLIVGGGPRGFHPDDEADRIACFSRVRVQELKDAGHSMHWTQPAALARLLVDHFDHPAE
jgi:pimeloyl-ACP methyl ester carboxylesterase